MAGVYILVTIGVLSVVIPMFWPHSIEDSSWETILTPPSFSDFHWFGTDANGRDLFVRTFFGARISLTIGMLTTAVALLIGVLYGAVAGFAGGNTDNLMMRIVDVLYALPLLFLIIILVSIFGQNIYLIFIAIGAVEWLTMARIVRGQTISIKRMEYVEAAYSIGLPTSKILTRYIIPNAIGPVIVYVSLLIPINIIVESYLSFLGLGVQEPLTSWGLMISEGRGSIDTAPWLLLFPASFLALTLFCFNFIGDGLRDALDPKDR
ncbi:MAG: ABC transporter permease subunit [Parvularculaceae bacterium]|nr:ABC transporter permease subunit [Parvularculaceae bacterium]